MISSPRKEFRPEEAEGKSLGDLWLDYLMTETEADDEAEREAAPEGKLYSLYQNQTSFGSRVRVKYVPLVGPCYTATLNRSHLCFMSCM